MEGDWWNLISTSIPEPWLWHNSMLFVHVGNELARGEESLKTFATCERRIGFLRFIFQFIWVFIAHTLQFDGLEIVAKF